jgi:hypothetical protein
MFNELAPNYLLHGNKVGQVPHKKLENIKVHEQPIARRKDFDEEDDETSVSPADKSHNTV